MCLHDVMSCAKKRYKLNSMNVFALSYLQIIWITFCQTEILSHNNRLPRLEQLGIM